MMLKMNGLKPAKTVVSALFVLLISVDIIMLVVIRSRELLFLVIKTTGVHVYHLTPNSLSSGEPMSRTRGEPSSSSF
jgi:hypothetical protein